MIVQLSHESYTRQDATKMCEQFAIEESFHVFAEGGRSSELTASAVKVHQKLTTSLLSQDQQLLPEVFVGFVALLCLIVIDSRMVFARSDIPPYFRRFNAGTR
jgi:hypothetical protein